MVDPIKDILEKNNKPSMSSKAESHHSAAMGNVDRSQFRFGGDDYYHYGDEVSRKKFEEITAIYNFDLRNALGLILSTFKRKAKEQTVVSFAMYTSYPIPLIHLSKRLAIPLGFTNNVRIYQQLITIGSEYNKSKDKLLQELYLLCGCSVQEGHLVIAFHLKSSKYFEEILEGISVAAQNELESKVIALFAVEDECKLPESVFQLPVPQIMGIDFAEWEHHHLDKKHWVNVGETAQLWEEVFDLESCVDECYYLNQVYNHLDWVIDKLNVIDDLDTFHQCLLRRKQIIVTTRRRMNG